MSFADTGSSGAIVWRVVGREQGSAGQYRTGDRPWHREGPFPSGVDMPRDATLTHTEVAGTGPDIGAMLVAGQQGEGIAGGQRRDIGGTEEEIVVEAHLPVRRERRLLAITRGLILHFEDPLARPQPAHGDI